MHTQGSIQSLAPTEPTLAEELAALGDEVVEMTNLREEDTGVVGIIFMSTALGSLGPRVKYYSKAGRNQPSFSVSISDNPRVLASSLPAREVRRAEAGVASWVALNHEELLRFWNEGDKWSAREFIEFVALLKKV